MSQDEAPIEALTTDATATVLLCVSVEGRKSSGGPRALTVREYNGLARWLHGQGMPRMRWHWPRRSIAPEH